ncbi:MAG: cob(I)yrinic acid a,c-diamide adenosyltransferase [Eubacteriales bacterium]
MNKGYIQVYTGNGKGKTTAALGLSLRAICAGKKVFFGQFMKGQPYSELKAQEFLPGFQMEQFGGLYFVNGNPSDQDIKDAKAGLQRMEKVLISSDYDLVIFDEINTSIHFNLLTVEEVVKVLKKRPEETEVILTGRYAPDEIILIADLVTEMKEIKHYYSVGVPARKGIEN